MPGFVLHVGATVMCLHGGQAKPTTPNPRVLVNGQPIVTQASTFVITGCPFSVGSAPSPCLTAQMVMASTRIFAGGQPVLLQDSQAVSTPNAARLNAVTVQPRVRGV